jgi:TolB-like protein/DNA-binding winged helix-turn-helix (wHTH) protein/tetratricopeptide (TPR) repeat protein
MDVNLKQGFTLGDWEVQPLRGQVIGPSGPVHMEPKVMDVLIALASRPGEVIERTELVNEVWGGRAVTDEPLTRCIAELRRILKDSRREPSYVETVPKRGYRLVAPVKTQVSAEATAQGEPEATQAEPGVRKSWWTRQLVELRARRVSRRAAVYAVVGIVFLALSAKFVLDRTFREQQPDVEAATPAAVSIAVLPFANLSDQGENEYFSDGLSEEIMNRLANVDGLLVVARASSFSFKGSDQDARTIAGELGVSHLLDGSVRKDRDRIRISAQLVDRDGYQLWLKSYEGVLNVDDVFSLQDEIANDIVTEVRPALLVEGAQEPIRTEPPTDNISAYELVLRGRFHMQRREESPLRRSIALFEQAIDLDESYGDAYVALASAHALLPFYSYEPVESAFDLAMTTIEKGAQRDSSVDSKAAGIMSFMLFNSEWRWIESEIGFRRALEYSPHDAELLQWYSQFLGSVGRREESLDFAMQAKQLDRLSPVANHRLAIAYLWTGKNDLARQQYELAKELGMAPTANAEAYLIMLIRLGELDKARSLMIGLQKMLGYGTDWIDPVMRALQDPAHIPAAVEAVARAERSNDISKQHLFGVWVYLNETDRALNIALRLVQDRPSFNTEILFVEETAALRSNPRFNELIRAVALHRYWENFGWPEMCHPDGEQIVCN